MPETVSPSVSQESNTDDVWDTLADQVEGVTSINLQDLCCMSSCLNLVMVLLENNTLESALVDLSEWELKFNITDEDIQKGMALMQQDE